VIFEFQREIANGEWKALGLARTAADDFDVGGAVRATHIVSYECEAAIDAASLLCATCCGPTAPRFAIVGSLSGP